MKKMLTIVLILTLAVPAAALADDQDPIVGCWYMCIAAKDLPGGIVDEEYIYSPMIFVFTPGGQILVQETDFTESSGTAGTVSNAGKWEKTEDGKYITSVIAIGENEAMLDSDILAACVLNSSTYVLLRRMIPFDIYNEMHKKN